MTRKRRSATASEPDPPGWDKPYPKAVWDAFMADLEEEAQQYTEDVVRAMKKNLAAREGQEPAPDNDAPPQ